MVKINWMMIDSMYINHHQDESNNFRGGEQDEVYSDYQR